VDAVRLVGAQESHVRAVKMARDKMDDAGCGRWTDSSDFVKATHSKKRTAQRIGTVALGVCLALRM
jgi:hypothetical protein